MNRLYELGLTTEEIEERLAEVDTHQRLSHKTARFMGPLLNKLGGVTVLGSNEFASRTKPSLLAPHHRSYWDIPVVGLVYAQLTEEADGVPSYPRFVARTSLDIGPIGDYFSRRGAIYVRRGEELEGQSAEIEIDEALENGEDVVIFPKGTRKLGGDDFREKDLKRSIAFTAMKQGTPIRPFWLARTKFFEGRAVMVVRPEIEVEKFEVETIERDPERAEPTIPDIEVARALRKNSKIIRARIYEELMAGKQIAEKHLAKAE